jgi:hypothetical protein
MITEISRTTFSRCHSCCCSRRVDCCSSLQTRNAQPDFRPEDPGKFRRSIGLSDHVSWNVGKGVNLRSASQLWLLNIWSVFRHFVFEWLFWFKRVCLQRSPGQMIEFWPRMNDLTVWREICISQFSSNEAKSIIFISFNTLVLWQILVRIYQNTVSIIRPDLTRKTLRMWGQALWWMPCFAKYEQGSVITQHGSA